MNKRGNVVMFPSGKVCKDCHDPISARRIKAVPTATRCEECQQEREADIKRARLFSRPRDIEIIRG
jgi:hypothetical protein